MRDESQNALLKTLEEPPGLRPPDPAHRRAGDAPGDDRLALPAGRLRAAAAGSDRSALSGAGTRRRDRRRRSPLSRRRGPRPLLLSDSGKTLRAAALGLGRAVGGDSPDTQRASASAESPPTAPTAWGNCSKAAESAGDEAEAATREPLEEEAEAGVKRSARRISATKPNAPAAAAAPRSSTSAWSCSPPGSATSPRLRQAPPKSSTTTTASPSCNPASIDPARPRRAAELVQDTRRRLDLNVSEELALEALVVSPRCRSRLDDCLGPLPSPMPAPAPAG